MQEKNALEIYDFLDSYDLLSNSSKYWWPNAGEFEVVIGSILTQNTSWKNVEKSLNNLDGFLELHEFVRLSEEELKQKIHPSGFYNQKAPRLLSIAQNIQKEFENFENFQKNVSREWLLSQKGIGQESADAILCYGCFRDEMVVDTYTKRLLKSFGVVFDKYGDYKVYFKNVCSSKKDVNLVYARFHGMIVEYNKKLKSFK